MSIDRRVEYSTQISPHPENQILTNLQARKAWGAGESIQFLNTSGVWIEISGTVSVGVFDNPNLKFRIAKNDTNPEFVCTNVQIPKNFSPIRGERYWFIRVDKGTISVESDIYMNDPETPQKVWKTEELANIALKCAMALIK